MLIITGTGTGVGKTVVTAAIAAVAAAVGRAVACVKPAQTGVAAGGESDVQAVSRLSGLSDVHELARYPEPLAPATAARRAGAAPVPLAALAGRIRALTGRDLILIEGAGGLLVRLDADGATVAGLAGVLGAPLLVVAAAGLGTLNAAALTCEAIRARGLKTAGVVIGSWPAQPGPAETANLADLPAYTHAPLLGAIPEGAGQLGRRDFLAAARNSLAPSLGGTWPGTGGPPPAPGPLQQAWRLPP